MAQLPIPDVYSVDREHAGRAGSVLARAFSDTVQFSTVLPDGASRQRKLESLFTGTVKMTFSAKGVAERTAKFEGVALWLPPGRDIGFWPMLRSAVASAPLILTPPYPNLRRLMGMLRQFDDTQKQMMPDPHWHLMALGVDPAHQRRAFGPALVIRGRERADAHGAPIYVETETGPNVTFYEKLGFDVLDEIVIEAYDLPFTLMVRRPGRSA